MASHNSSELLLTGLSLRSMMTDCPLGAFRVTVKTCNANGDCVNACLVRVFEKGPDGRCTVVNEDLCFGCTACLAQCLDEGVMIVPREPPKKVTPEELLQ